MKKFILPFFLLVSFLSSSQHLYKDLWSTMSFSEANNELKEHYDYKYTNIKIGELESLFSFSTGNSRDLKKNPFNVNYIALIGGGLYYIEDWDFENQMPKSRLVGVQLDLETNFKNLYNDVEELYNFFINIQPKKHFLSRVVSVSANGGNNITQPVITVIPEGKYERVSVLGAFSRKEMVYSDYESNTLMHLKLNTTITEGLFAPRANSKNILICSQFYANNKVGLKIIISS